MNVLYMCVTIYMFLYVQMWSHVCVHHVEFRGQSSRIVTPVFEAGSIIGLELTMASQWAPASSWLCLKNTGITSLLTTLSIFVRVLGNLAQFSMLVKHEL